MDDLDIEQRGPGRPRKEFKNASYHTQKSQTDEGMDYLRQLATDLGISVTYLINFYGKRQANINGDEFCIKYIMIDVVLCFMIV